MSGLTVSLLCPGEACSFLKGNRGTLGLGKRARVEGTWRSGGKGSCAKDGFYEKEQLKRKINNCAKEKSPLEYSIN